MKNSERREIKRIYSVNTFINECKNINLDVTIILDDLKIKEKFNKKYNDDNFKIVQRLGWRMFLKNINEFSKIYIFIYDKEITLFINNPMNLRNLIKDNDINFEENINLLRVDNIIIYDYKNDIALYLEQDCGLGIYKFV